MRITCCCCNRQLIKGCTRPNDIITTYDGAKAGNTYDSPFCGECAKDLDENGLFPEEWASAGPEYAEYLRNKELDKEPCQFR